MPQEPSGDRRITPLAEGTAEGELVIKEENEDEGLMEEESGIGTVLLLGSAVDVIKVLIESTVDGIARVSLQEPKSSSQPAEQYSVPEPQKPYSLPTRGRTLGFFFNEFTRRTECAMWWGVLILPGETHSRGQNWSRNKSFPSETRRFHR